MSKKRITYKNLGYDDYLTKKASVFRKPRSLEDMMRERETDLRIKLLKKQLTIKNNLNFCRFENNTFFITLNNNTEKTIIFETRRKTFYMLRIFSALFEHWKKHGNTPLSKKEILAKILQDDAASNFLTNQVGNIRQKIKASGLLDVVSIDYDYKTNGYVLNIKNPKQINTV